MTDQINRQEIINAICEMKKDECIELITGDFIQKTIYKHYPYKLNFGNKRYGLYEITETILDRYNEYCESVK